jgi:transketolase
MVVSPAAACARPFAPLSIDGLREMARINRLDTVEMYMTAGNGHFGGCFSCAEILTALYFAVLRVDADRPDWAERDRFLMSKGHAAPALYSALIRRGFIPQAWIHEYEAHVGARLMTHPSRRYQPGVDASGGALGHGLSLGVGMALAGRLDARDYRVYVLLGDGELHEGSVWEAAACAAKYRLDRLVAIVDANGLCVDGKVEEVLPMEPLRAKWEAFGWEALELDGHDFEALLPALDIPRGPRGGRPRLIVARTVKGRGVSFMEHARRWHADTISREDYRRAVIELERER